jgi:hypothetical protein
MKLKHSIAILAILGATSLFSSDLNTVNALVEKINSTNDVNKKGELLEDLNLELQLIAPKDYQEARELVNKKLKSLNKNS